MAHRPLLWRALENVLRWLDRTVDAAFRRSAERQVAELISRRGGSLTDETERLIGQISLGRCGPGS